MGSAPDPNIRALLNNLNKILNPDLFLTKCLQVIKLICHHALSLITHMLHQA
jgi:hypothetical protein